MTNEFAAKIIEHIYSIDSSILDDFELMQSPVKFTLAEIIFIRERNNSEIDNQTKKNMTHDTNGEINRQDKI